MNDRLNLTVKSGIAEVQLNRAKKHNALDHKMFESLIETGERLSKDNSIRAIILHGSGKSFCAGIDLTMFAGEGMSQDFSKKMLPREKSLANYYQSAAYVWREIPVPVIAALHGVTYGGGLQIALGADIRYASKDSTFSVMEIKWGIIPDMAMTTSIPSIMRIDQALEMAMTGDVINASEANSLGLVTAITSDPLEKARSLANNLVNKSPDAIRAIKKLFYETWKNNDQSSLLLEAQLQKRVMSGSNQMEAVKSSINRTPPNFTDPE